MLGAEFLEYAAVSLYFNPAVLDRDVAALRGAGYHIVRADASRWLSAVDTHRELSALFGFPAHYGHNWAAFNDCLGDVRDRAYGFPPDAAGLVLVLTGFDAFAATCPGDAHLLLDIYADHQRSALITGDHLLCLVQSDDPSLVLAPVGATAPRWNRDEWLNRNRGL